MVKITDETKLVTNPNPYSAPITESGNQVQGEPAVKVSLLDLAKPIFIKWERLRIVYIVVVGAVSVAALLRNGPTDDGLFTLVAGFFIANALYFAGPITEVYVSWLRGSNETLWLRFLLFVSGVMITSALAVTVLKYAGGNF